MLVGVEANLIQKGGLAQHEGGGRQGGARGELVAGVGGGGGGEEVVQRDGARVFSKS